MKLYDCSVKNEMKQEIGWMIRDNNGKAVCNFIPNVQSIIFIRYETKVEQYLKLNLQFQKGENVEVYVLLKDIEKTEWISICERCIVNSCNKNAKGIIGNIIRNNLHSAPHETWCGVERTGLYRVENSVFFNVGEEVIIREQDKEKKLNIWQEPLPFKLEIDPYITKKEAFDGIMELINLSPEVGSILVSHTIAGFLRAAYKEAGFNPCVILEIVGESGMLKSHYVPHLVQLYNRKSGIRAATRFNSTHRFIEELLHEYSDCTVVLDDLHTAQAAEIKRRNEVAAEEIIRRISDDMGQGYKEGKVMVQKKFRANVVLIGEYTIGQDSTVSRVLVVNLTKRPDGKILDKYQREKPLLVSTFYNYFIKWYVDNYEEIVEEINKRLSEFRENTVDSSIHGRLRDTQFYLQTSFMFFLQFCNESKFITSYDTEKRYELFARRLIKLIQAQQARIKFDSGKRKDIDFLEFIRKLYKKNQISLASSVDTFNPKKHDGLIYYQCLCVRRKSLEKLIQKYFRNVCIDEVIRKLVDTNALKQVGDKRTVKISTLNKEVGAIRFYAIWLHALE